jgi:hypothetical protein
MSKKIKHPNERHLTKMYGNNDAKKKAYRRGWHMVGQRLAEQRANKPATTRSK